MLVKSTQSLLIKMIKKGKALLKEMKGNDDRGRAVFNPSQTKIQVHMEEKKKKENFMKQNSEE